MKPGWFKNSWQLLVRSANHFMDFNGFKLSAALSYYTVFSIVPLLIVIISLAGIFFGHMAVEGKIYHEISGLVGSDTALQIQNIIRKTEESNHGKMGGLIGSVILIIGASGVFSEIQSSIYYLWSVPAPKKKVLLIAILRKLISFSLLIAISFVFMVSLIANALLDVLSDRLKLFFNGSMLNLFYIINLSLILLVISSMFMLIFKILPNTNISWKHAFAGALVTSILFLAGKFGIGYYLGHSEIGATYGATASIIILMLWIYYSSIILYFGACYTTIYAAYRGHPIHLS
ncbi:MAG TPA: YihY/virulence factor BrkB family protein [Puia sp.]|jgi:membrane protein|nr:YihY/virulence factor BrkB family protein [Puia sp.]